MAAEQALLQQYLDWCGQEADETTEGALNLRGMVSGARGANAPVVAEAERAGKICAIGLVA